MDCPNFSDPVLLLSIVTPHINIVRSRVRVYGTSLYFFFFLQLSVNLKLFANKRFQKYTCFTKKCNEPGREEVGYVW